MNDENKGLTRAKEIYRDRSRRVREMKAEGRKVIGYPCVYVPVEMLTAAGVVPYRTCGDMAEPVTEADRALPTSFCPIMRSCLDCALKGKNDFLDGMATVHSSDPQEKTARVWESYTEYPYFHFIDLPGTLRPEAFEYFKGQLVDFQKTLESFTKVVLAPERLRAAIQTHNRQRAMVRDLYELTKPDPPLVSGTEIVQVVKALMSLPAEEGNDLLSQVLQEVRERREGRPSKKPIRLLVWSSTLDDTEVMEILEGGAHAVIDDHCGGLRAYRADVRETDDPLDGLARYYLGEITCARTFKESVLGETRKDYQKDLESRFGYLKELIRNWNVQGAILLLVRYCDPFAFEMPSLKDYLDSLKIPNTFIEYDYTLGALAPIRTRVEAFLETIG